MRRFLIFPVLLAAICSGVLLPFSALAQEGEQQPAYAKYIVDETQAVMLMRPGAIMKDAFVRRVIRDHPELLQGLALTFEDRFGVPFSACSSFISAQLADVRIKAFDMEYSQSLMIAVFDRSIDPQRVLASDELTHEWEEITVDGGSYFRAKSTESDLPDFSDPAFETCYAFPTDNVYIETTEAKIRTVLSGGGSDEWAKRLASIPADQLVTAIAGPRTLTEFTAVFKEMPGMPPGIAMHVPTLKKVQRAELALSFSGDNMVTLSMEAESAEDAAEIEDAADQLLEMARQLAPAVFATATEGAITPNQQEMLMALLNSVTMSADGDTTAIALPKLDQETERELIDYFGLTLKAADAARATADRLAKLHNTGIAAHNFHDIHGKLPPRDDANGRDADGRPLLSWRVHLLPYLEANDLYKQFHMDEPWDSEHNKTLLPKMPKLFALSDDLPEGMTDVIAPYGDNTIFGHTRSVSFRDVLDGTSNTVMCFEAAPEHAVPWTKPDDFQFDPKAEDAMVRFGQPDAEKFAVLWTDASVEMASKSAPAWIIQALIDFKDGETVDRDDIQ